MSCNHQMLVVNTQVEDSDAADTCVSVSISCENCGVPFKFKGVDGLSWCEHHGGVGVSADENHVYLLIEPGQRQLQ